MSAASITNPQELLNRAVQAARAGDIASANALATEGTGLPRKDAAPFHAFLGMIEARSGNLDAAADHLARARKAKPDDTTIACNLISVLVDAGREDEALKVATPQLMRADASLRVARMRAFLSQQAEKFEDAIAAYEYILSQNPDDFEALNNLGNARAGIDDLAGAEDALRKAMALDPKAVPTWLNLANALDAQDRVDDAVALLEDATARFPGEAQPPYQLYLLHRNRNNQEDALPALRIAAERAPQDADKQLELAAELGVARNVAEAEEAYRRVLALAPGTLDAYLGLAIQYEHTNRESEFAPLIAQARENGIEAEPLSFIEALELRRQKRFEEALEKLAQVPDDVEPIRTMHTRASLLDRLGQTDAAFAAYCETNALMAESPTEPLDRAAELRAQLEQEIVQLTPEWRESWQSAALPEDARPDPVFLLGFPRSGTTLLDTFLMGHPDAVVMEEQPPLNKVEEALGGMGAIADLDAEGLAAARRRYFEEVEQLVDLPQGATLVDKSPLFLYRLPLIKRLFPNAKIILALRHPCDVVLSCLMSNFRLNSAMANFLRLDDAAAFYDVCFRHWETARGLFDIDLHTIGYEQLVADTEGQVKPLIEWLGLEWHEALLDHTSTAKSRGLITTASYSQVVEPIYKRASGRWLRYRDHLEPAFSTLAPWAEKFGYGDPRKVSPEAAEQE